MSREVKGDEDMFVKGAITIDPETMGGTPVFTGTRVPIQTLFDYLMEDSLEVFLENFPGVARSQALEVLKTSDKEDIKQVDNY